MFASTPATTQRPSAEVPTALPVMGPGVANQYRESGFGVVSTLIHSPVKGEHPLPKPPTPKLVHQSDALRSNHDVLSGFDSH